ncbi:hypothetical protein JQM66_11925 [Oscillibacter valericigenes]|uniref:LptM family lipoprotein n=1 Tax=Oscillibacter valericigenes TaxID=351091 RepID=UPI001F18C861|nr:hypothetical protein [Oscillibacter valericigenes]MCF2665254.1 hypothetical protein [Oscillibacter valericigenes]
MRRLSFVLIGLLILALSGCGQKAQTPPPAPETPTAEIPAETPATPTTEDRNPTAAELGREETTELAFTVEGETELIPVTLYIGQGYSIYIPSEGWRLEKWVDDGIPEDTWESNLNDDVELTVLHLGEKTLEEAQTWVKAEEDDYQLVEDKQGGLGGTDAGDREMLEVRFHPSGSSMYAVLYKYPMEAAEGFGTRLGVMADTFQIME